MKVRALYYTTCIKECLEQHSVTVHMHVSYKQHTYMYMYMVKTPTIVTLCYQETSALFQHNVQIACSDKVCITYPYRHIPSKRFCS